jgi:hypothetical protein
MSVRDLINAIDEGDSIEIMQAFESEMASRVSTRLDDMRQDVAQSMFRSSVAEQAEEEVNLDEADSKVGANHLHVQPVKVDGKTKYKVHAVGKNFADGIKVGEHLSDNDLDDFSEMGGKVKHVS